MFKPDEIFALPESDEAIKDRIHYVLAQIEAIEADIANPGRMRGRDALEYMEWRGKAISAKSLYVQEISFLKTQQRIRLAANKRRKDQEHEQRVEAAIQERRERLARWQAQYGDTFQVEVVSRLLAVVATLAPRDVDPSDEIAEVLKVARAMVKEAGLEREVRL